MGSDVAVDERAVPTLAAGWTAFDIAHAGQDKLANLLGQLPGPSDAPSEVSDQAPPVPAYTPLSAGNPQPNPPDQQVQAPENKTPTENQAPKDQANDEYLHYKMDEGEQAQQN